MIIKKKRLEKITGSNVQPAEQQYEQDLQVSNAALYNEAPQPEYPQQYEQQQEYYQPEDQDQYNYQNEYSPQDNVLQEDGSKSYYDEQNPQYSDEISQQEQQYSEQSEQNEPPTEEIQQEEYVENVQQPPQQSIEQSADQPQAVSVQPPQNFKSEEEINLFDLDNIDFSQRQERRRGDRRRGFRRVDDRNLVSRAREEADAIRDAAQKEGYQAGLEQAQADIEDVKNSLSQFVCTKQEVFDAIAPELLEISVEIAKKIIKKEIEQGPEVLFNTVVDVLKTSLSKEETKVTLRVNPAEVNEVKQAVPELINLAGIDTKIVVLADEEVSEGGCQITTTNGIVDATLESRMRVVLQALREV